MFIRIAFQLVGSALTLCGCASLTPRPIFDDNLATASVAISEFNEPLTQNTNADVVRQHRAETLTALPTSQPKVRIQFVTNNRDLLDLDRAMSDYYLELSKKNSLPVQLVEDDIGLQPRHLLVGLGLLAAPTGRPEIPRNLEQLLCNLNNILCNRSSNGKFKWKNSKGDKLCLPDISWSDSIKFARIQIPKTDNLMATLDAKYGICTIYGKLCSAAVEKLQSDRLPDGTTRISILTQAANRQPVQSISNCTEEKSVLASSKFTSRGKENLEHLGIKVSSTKVNSTQLPNLEIKTILPNQRTTDISSQASTEKEARVPIESESLSLKDRLAFSRLSGIRPLSESFNVYSTAKSANPGVNAQSSITTELQDTPDDIISLAPPPSNTLLPATTTNIHNNQNYRTTPSQRLIPSETLIAELSEKNIIYYKQIGLPDIQMDVEAVKRPGVLVFDTAINICHAIIRDSVVQEIVASECTKPAELQKIEYRDGDDFDHGTHVAGLIAGQYVGIDPKASILPVAIVSDEMIMDDEAYNMIMQGMYKATMLPSRSFVPKVANFSADLKVNPNTVQKLTNFIIDSPDILFVAAAGNDGLSMDVVCDIMPACVRSFDFSNLIVVGGVEYANNRWQRWPLSRYGTRVDILAPANKLTSSLKDDGWLGTMSGTSQSTALISGLAARLFSRLNGPLASLSEGAYIKNRLLATAQFTPELKIATRSGIVDAGRALDIKSQVLWTKNEPNPIRGSIREIVDTNENGNSAVEFIGPNNAKLSINFCSIYRLSNSGNDTWTLALQPVGRDRGPRWAKMEIYRDLILNTQGRKIRFVTEDGKLKTIPLSDVVEFYDQFSWSEAC